MQNISKETILIFDFGSQYSQLIARRVRELNVFSEIVSHQLSAEEVKKTAPVGIILSGGPSSVYDEGAPGIDAEIFDLGIPILGICYGMQLGCNVLGGKVENAKGREYGRAKLSVNLPAELFEGLGDSIEVWMSHGDIVTTLTGDFETLAHTANSPYAAVRHKTGPFYGIQFHPEVVHTPRGKEILNNFLFRVCHARGDWKMENFIEMAIGRVREQVGGGRVLLGLSGGVDSGVAAALLQEAVGEQLTCIFVDNGLLRSNEADEVIEVFKEHFHINLRFADAGERFITELKGVSDPEMKRKIIGRVFIDVFKEEAARIEDVKFLAQGTIYPDVIESFSPRGGPSATIKSHHNVGGLPEELGFELVEPFRELFKDEVRQIGLKLGLPRHMIDRHPFPGPGLAVRIIGDVTPERLRIVCEADAIVMEEIRKEDLYEGIWQAFAVLLPVSSVGVMGDKRTYENTVALRIVDSSDGMTADWRYLPEELLRTISNRIVNEVKGVNRVVLDISSKPPATIEWE